MSGHHKKEAAIIGGSVGGLALAAIGTLESIEQVFQVVAIAFAAFCIWLTVRIVNRRERWAMLALAAALLVWMYAAISVHQLLQPVPSFTLDGLH